MPILRIPNIRYTYWSAALSILVLWVGIVSFPLAAATTTFASVFHSQAKSSPVTSQLSTPRPHHARSDIMTSSRSSSSSAPLITKMATQNSLVKRNIDFVLKLPRGGGFHESMSKNLKGKGRNDDLAQQKKNPRPDALIRMGIETSLGTLFIFLGESSSWILPMVSSAGAFCIALLLAEIAYCLGGKDGLEIISALSTLFQ